jgi:hypothetical protein
MVTLDAAVAGGIVQARAAERALHEDASSWAIQADGWRVPVQRTLDEAALTITFDGILPCDQSASVLELVHHGDLVSRMAYAVQGPCALKWAFSFGRTADRAG